MLDNDTILKIASNHNKSAAQICLRWLIQKDIVPVVKSLHETRMIENTEIFDFSLSEEEMRLIDELPECGGMNADPDDPRRDY